MDQRLAEALFCNTDRSKIKTCSAVPCMPYVSNERNFEGLLFTSNKVILECLNFKPCFNLQPDLYICNMYVTKVEHGFKSSIEEKRRARPQEALRQMIKSFITQTFQVRMCQRHQKCPRRRKNE